jgi:hypothetical protein
VARTREHKCFSLIHRNILRTYEYNQPSYVLYMYMYLYGCLDFRLSTPEAVIGYAFNPVIFQAVKLQILTYYVELI